MTNISRYRLGRSMRLYEALLRGETVNGHRMGDPGLSYEQCVKALDQYRAIWDQQEKQNQRGKKS